MVRIFRFSTLSLLISLSLVAMEDKSDWASFIADLDGIELPTSFKKSESAAKFSFVSYTPNKTPPQFIEESKSSITGNNDEEKRKNAMGSCPSKVLTFDRYLEIERIDLVESERNLFKAIDEFDFYNIGKALKELGYPKRINADDDSKPAKYARLSITNEAGQTPEEKAILNGCTVLADFLKRPKPENDDDAIVAELIEKRRPQLIISTGNEENLSHSDSSLGTTTCCFGVSKTHK